MKTILYFTASWCGPCKALAPRMEKLASQINYRKIDVDSNQEFAAKYGVRNIPTVLVFKNGEVVEKQVGVAPKATYAQKIDAHL